MTEKKRKTVGEITSEILNKPNLDTKQPVIDTQKEMNKTFLPEVEKCIENHKHWTDPFYVLVINKKERLITNVIRQYFTATQCLPIPDYDQTVFKYTPSTGDLEFLWTVPDKNTIEFLIFAENNLPKEQAQLINYCKHFKAGTLDTTYGK